jgi:hypothetical protein
VGKKMKIEMPQIKKYAILKIEKEYGDKFEDAVIRTFVDAEITVDDKKVIFEEESTVYGLMNKDINEIRTELEGTLNGSVQYVKEKATKLINVILAVKEYCESNNIEFNIKIV